MADGSCHPQPGDLIEIDQPFHQHWALYMGDEYVINMTPVGKQDLKLGVHKVRVFTRKVEKQCLKEVVQKNTWHVNNKSHQYHTPLPVEEIIRRAEDYIGKEVTYRVFGSNCEHFVTMLRYGEGVSDQWTCLHGKINGMINDGYYASPGDLIKIEQPGYQHWALYVGKGYVIHVTAIAGTVTLITERAKVKKQLLKDVAKKDSWAVNNMYDHCRSPFPVEEIIRRAEDWIDKEVPYRLLSQNCEHFVTMLRYGEEVSFQARKTVGQLISSTVTSVLEYVIDSFWPRASTVASVGFGFVTSTVLDSSSIARSLIFTKFMKKEEDILQQTCC